MSDYTHQDKGAPRRRLHFASPPRRVWGENCVVEAMETWEKELLRRHDYPSFTSTFLDAIYRSIDETDAGRETDHAASSRRTVSVAKERTSIPPRRLPPAVTSSCFKNSSYGRFSSPSEPDSAASRRLQSRRSAPPRNLLALPAPIPLFSGRRGGLPRRRRSGAGRGTS